VLIISVQAAKNMWTEYEQVDVFMRVTCFFNWTPFRRSYQVGHDTKPNLVTAHIINISLYVFMEMPTESAGRWNESFKLTILKTETSFCLISAPRIECEDKGESFLSLQIVQI